jgi:hypothetical protein
VLPALMMLLQSACLLAAVLCWAAVLAGHAARGIAFITFTSLPACLPAILCCDALLPCHAARGIAFITFASQDAADNALQYDGEQLEGQTLKVGRRQKSEAVRKGFERCKTI